MKRAVFFSPLLLSVALSPALLQNNCNRSGNPTLTLFQVEAGGLDRVVDFESSNTRYSGWVLGATEVTLRAVAADAGSTLTWTIGEGVNDLGVGFGEATVAIGPTIPAIAVTVKAPGGATRSYQLDFDPACTGGDCNDNNSCTTDVCNTGTSECEFTTLSNGTACDFAAVGDGTCLSGVCDGDAPDPPPATFTIPNVCLYIGAVFDIVQSPITITMDPGPIESGSTVDVELVEVNVEIPQPLLQGILFTAQAQEGIFITADRTTVTVGVATGGTGPDQVATDIGDPNFTVPITPIQSPDGAPDNPAGSYNCYETIAPGFDEFVTPLNLLGTRPCGTSCGGGPTFCEGAGRPLAIGPSNLTVAGGSTATYTVTGAPGTNLCFEIVGVDVTDPAYPGIGLTGPTYINASVHPGIAPTPIECGPGTLSGDTREPLADSQRLCFPIFR